MKINRCNCGGEGEKLEQEFAKYIGRLKIPFSRFSFKCSSCGIMTMWDDAESGALLSWNAVMSKEEYIGVLEETKQKLVDVLMDKDTSKYNINPMIKISGELKILPDDVVKVLEAVVSYEEKLKSEYQDCVFCGRGNYEFEDPSHADDCPVPLAEKLLKQNVENNK